MNNIIKIILFAALILNSSVLGAQATFFENFDNLGCPSSPCSGSVTPSCLGSNAGGTSHGTPHITDGRNFCGSDGMLWLGHNGPNTISEGIFFSFNFEDGKSYTVSFESDVYNTISSPPLSGFALNVIAANGLTHQTNSCGGAPPTISDSENMIDPISYTTLDGCVVTTFTYCPESDYDQFWIYPTNTDGSSFGMVLLVDDIKIEEDCPPYKVFNNPWFDISPGVYEYRDYIRTETPQSSGIVENDPNSYTLFFAGDYIHLKPRTHIRANHDFYFWAQIRPCGEDCPGSGKGRSNSIHDESLLETEVASLDQVTIFPNPASDYLQIQSPAFLQEEAIVHLSIYSINGQLLLERNNLTLYEQPQINISNIPNGLYLVKLLMGADVKTIKLMIE